MMKNDLRIKKEFEDFAKTVSMPSFSPKRPISKYAFVPGITATGKATFKGLKTQSTRVDFIKLI